MKRGYDYARDIASKKLPSSRTLYLIAKRFLEDTKRKDIYMNEDLIKKILTVIEKYLKTEDGSTITLHPFQVFIIINIFGWHYKDGDRRRFNTALLFMVRGVGKSFMAGLIGLIDMLFPNKIDKNPSSVTLAASTHKQTGAVFKQVKDILRNSNPLITDKFKMPRTTYDHMGVLSYGGANMSTVSSQSTSTEGMNPSMWVLDELHIFKDDSLLSSLQYAGQKRENPLGVIISTAGSNLGAPLHQMYNNYKLALEKKTMQDSVFVLIYDLDKQDIDDWENCLTNGSFIKVNPLFVDSSSNKTCRMAKQFFDDLKINPSKTNEFKTKMLNIFVESKNKWMSKFSIESKSKKLDLSDYKGWNAWVGIDLSKKNDLTACSLLLVKDNKYRVFTKCYLPDAIKEKNDIFWNAMINHGYLDLTEGFSVDYEPMIQWLMHIRKEFDLNIQQVMYDNWNAAYIVKRLNEEDFDIMEHKQSHAAFNGAVANAENLILDPDIDLLFDENKLVPYCFDNVVLTQDRNGNSKPDKTDYTKKVDVAISFLQAVGAYFHDFENDNIDTGDIEVFVL